MAGRVKRCLDPIDSSPVFREITAQQKLQASPGRPSDPLSPNRQRYMPASRLHNHAALNPWLAPRFFSGSSRAGLTLTPLAYADSQSL